MFGKKGVNAVVAVVMMVLIVVTGVVILWQGIMPVVRNNFNAEEVKTNVYVSSEGGYTYFDEDDNAFCVQVKRGSDDNELSKIEVVFEKEGNSYKGYFD